MRLVVRSQDAFSLCVRPVQRVVERVGRDLIDNVADGSFCVGGPNDNEYCWCGFDFNNIRIREEWIRKFHDGFNAYQGRSKVDSRGTVSWLSRSPPVDYELVKRLNPGQLIPGEMASVDLQVPRAAGMGTTGDHPFITTDIPVLSEQLPRAQALVETLKQDTAGNCYLQHVHDQGHLDARHVHIQCNRDRVSTPDRDIPSGTLLDMVADTVSRMIEP